MNVAPSFGISQLTTFNFNASASDADGDPLTYTWDLQGSTFNGSAGTVTYTGGGTATLRVTVTDGKGGSATDTRTITVGSMTGTWTVTLAGCGTFNMTLTQSSTTVSGSFVMPTAFCNAPAGSTGVTDPAEPGTFDQNGNLRIRLKVGVFLDFYITGVMDSSGRRVNGNASNSGFNGNVVTMTK